jgi:beta-lactamase class A
MTAATSGVAQPDSGTPQAGPADATDPGPWPDPSREAAARARIAEIVAGVDGVVGLMARGLTTGRALRHRADEVFPTASVFKVPLLYALYRRADAGEIDLDRRVTLTADHRVPGSGVLQDLAPGLAPTVRDLAVLMTVISDNAATDLLVDLVGKERIAAELAGLGLRATAVPLTCREIFCAATGLAPDDPATTYDALREALREAERDPDSVAYADDARNDTSTPADMVELLAAMHRGEGLTPASREAVLDILGRQKSETILPARLPENTRIAHKTGSLRGIRNDVGIVDAPDGPYAVAIFAKRLADEAAAVRSLADLSLAVWDAFTPPA